MKNAISMAVATIVCMVSIEKIPKTNNFPALVLLSVLIWLASYIVTLLVLDLAGIKGRR